MQNGIITLARDADSTPATQNMHSGQSCRVPYRAVTAVVMGSFQLYHYSNIVAASEWRTSVMTVILKV